MKEEVSSFDHSVMMKALAGGYVSVTFYWYEVVRMSEAPSEEAQV